MDRDQILIEADELLGRIGNSNLRIFDASVLANRSDNDAAPMTAYGKYLEGHIPGAMFLQHAAISDADSPYQYTLLQEAALAKCLGDIGISNDAEVVIYATDMIGWATRIWWILRYAGHNNVRVLNGGLYAWQQAGGTTETEDTRFAPASFKSSLRPGMFASRAEVEAAVNNEAVCTINTLPEAAWQEAHIPGSISHSFFDLVHRKGTAFLDNDKLAASLDKKPQQARTITYCGGGIAATVNAIAYLLVGNENVGVYDGSMSEWTGEGLPTAKGEASA
jgi:thiosulfate/3-mercaptopyruvate sulfurtransferase